jgi:hypothetical protein
LTLLTLANSITGKCICRRLPLFIKTMPIDYLEFIKVKIKANIEGRLDPAIKRIMEVDPDNPEKSKGLLLLFAKCGEEGMQDRLPAIQEAIDKEREGSIHAEFQLIFDYCKDGITDGLHNILTHEFKSQYDKSKYIPLAKEVAKQYVVSYYQKQDLPSRGNLRQIHFPVIELARVSNVKGSYFYKSLDFA